MTEMGTAPSSPVNSWRLPRASATKAEAEPRTLPQKSTLAKISVTSDTRQSFDLGTLGPGEYQDATFKLVVNQQAESIPVTVDLLEKHGKFGKEGIELPLALDKPTDQITEVQVEDQETDVAMQTGERLSVDVESNIPTTPMDRPDAMAVVIGIQSYASEGGRTSSTPDATPVSCAST